MNIAEQYIEDVLSGKIIAGKYVKLAVKRHLSDLEKKDSPFYFDNRSGEKILSFFPIMKHFKGRKFSGKPFELAGWQAFINYVLYGWKYKEEDARRFTMAYTEVAKKNGKSMLCSGNGLYMLRFDGEPGSEVYSAATNRDQACEVFNMARAIVTGNSDLKKYITV